MITKHASFAEARGQVRAALAATGSGRPEAYIDCWARSDDTTLFGAWGPIEKGHQRLVETFRWVGRRFTGGMLVPEDVVSFESGDLAYTVGFERGEVSVDANAPTMMTIRVTHIYRRRRMVSRPSSRRFPAVRPARRRLALGGTGWGNLISAVLGAMGTVRFGWSGGSRHSSPPASNWCVLGVAVCGLFKSLVGSHEGWLHKGKGLGRDDASQVRGGVEPIMRVEHASPAL
jgi:hypothetical protein